MEKGNRNTALEIETENTKAGEGDCTEKQKKKLNSWGKEKKSQQGGKITIANEENRDKEKHSKNGEVFHRDS